MTGKITIGVVGLHFGRQIIEQHLLEGPGREFFQLAGVCDLDVAALEEAASRYNAPAFASLDAMLAEPDIAAIGLITGPTNRAALIQKCIRAGKHVMTTKPLEKDADAALAVLREARQLGMAVHLNSPSPLPREYMRQILDWQREHNLGEPVGARFEVWTRYREKADGSWYDDPAQCPAAPIFRLGIYGINDLCRLLGEPKAVQVMHSRLFTQRPTADNANLTIQFANGCLASVYASFGIHDRRGYHVSVNIGYENGAIWSDESGLRLRTAALGETQLTALVKPPDIIGEYQWDVFARAIRGEEIAGELTPEEAVASVRILHAMTEGQMSGRMVQIRDLPSNAAQSVSSKSKTKELCGLAQ